MRGEVAKHGGVDQLVVDFLYAQRVSSADFIGEPAPASKTDEFGISRAKEHRLKKPVFGDEQTDASD